MAIVPEASAELTFKNLIGILANFLRFIFSKWLILLIFGITGGLLGITYAWVQKPSYEAVLTFSTDDDNGGSAGGLAGIAAQFGFDLGGAGSVFTGDNVVALMQSRKIIFSALQTKVDYKNKKETLLNIYLETTGMSEGFKKSPILKNVSFPAEQKPETYSRLQDSVLLIVIKNINLNVLKVDKPDKKIDLYEVRCKSPDETFSIAFTNQLIKEVSDFYIQSKTKRSQITVTVLQKSADSLRQAFNAALSGRAALADANLNTAFQSPIVGIQKKQTDITVLSTAYGEILKNLELAKFNLLRETPLITIIDEPMGPLLDLKMGRLIGGIIGGFLFGFLGIGYLLTAKALKEIKAG